MVVIVRKYFLSYKEHNQLKIVYFVSYFEEKLRKDFFLEKTVPFTLGTRYRAVLVIGSNPLSGLNLSIRDR